MTGNRLFQLTAVFCVAVPALIACSPLGTPKDDGADAAAAARHGTMGRGPNRVLHYPNYSKAQHATGVEMTSVSAYVTEPLVNYRRGPSTEALAASGIQLRVMDEVKPRNASDASGGSRPGVAAPALTAESFKATSRSSAVAPPPALVASFGSVDYTTNLTETGGFAAIPPDPDAAVGPNHVVNVANKIIAFHQKNGTVDFTDSLADFFAAESPDTLTFDPKVVFDPFEGRFLVVTLELEDDGAGGNPEISEILLAVSDDADPNGTWCTTTIPGNTMIDGVDTWADYPSFAVDEEAVYITANMFEFVSGTTSIGVFLWIVDKGVAGGLYDCATATVSKYDVAGDVTMPPFNVTMQPAQIHGKAPAGVGTYLVGYGGITTGMEPGGELFQVIRIDDPLGSPTFTFDFVDVGDIEDFASFENAPQSGPPGVMAIETNDRRTLDAEWFDNVLWATTTISPTAAVTGVGGGTDAGEITAHWVAIDTSTPGSPVVSDQGSIFGDDNTADLHTFFPSVAVNGRGQVGFGYSGSAASIFASSYYTARNPGDAAGATQGTALLKAGEASYVRTFCGGENRWGDYTSAETDPVDGCFWFYNEHALSVGNVIDCDPAGPGPEDEEGRWATHYGKMCPTGACPADMYLANLDLGGAQARKAGSRITTGASVDVKSGADVTFVALDTIVFSNGFSVENNATFAAELKADPCL